MEVWKDIDWIEGCDGAYKVSNFGNVITLRNGHWVEVGSKRHA